MTDEMYVRVCDYFTAPELAELLGISTSTLMLALEEVGDFLDEDTIAELEEIMEHGAP